MRRRRPETTVEAWTRLRRANLVLVGRVSQGFASLAPRGKIAKVALAIAYAAILAAALILDET